MVDSRLMTSASLKSNLTKAKRVAHRNTTRGQSCSQISLPCFICLSGDHRTKKTLEPLKFNYILYLFFFFKKKTKKKNHQVCVELCKDNVK